MQSTGGSRLSQIQAGFQQRQLVEKEQKLVRMYEAAQARALGKVKAGTDTVPGNANSQQAGKVRQMFEERRTKGIDKSYPLQPLPNAGQGNGVSKQVVRNGVHKTVTSHVDGESRHVEVTVETRKTSSSVNNNIEESSTVTRSHHFESDRDTDYNLNDEEFPFEDNIAAFERLDLDPPASSNGMIGKGLAANKLPNVGGSLPSRRPLKSDARTSNTSNGLVKERIAPRNTLSQGEVKDKPRVSPTMRTVRPTVPKARPTAAVASPNITKAAPLPTPMKSPAHERPSPKTPSKTSSPSPNTMSAPRAKTTIVRNVVTLQPTPSSKPTSGGSTEGCCRICQRRFAPDRLQKHEEICAKAASKKRKPYDALKHRVAGTEAETYVRHAKKTAGRGGAPKVSPVAAAPPAKPSNWRKKHEEFINAIRAAKQVQAHINKGGKLSDLPPPPPSDTSDYISCPHCGRRFNQSAAERHIPKCKDFQFNKPKPSSRKR